MLKVNKKCEKWLNNIGNDDNRGTYENNDKCNDNKTKCQSVCIETDY